MLLHESFVDLFFGTRQRHKKIEFFTNLNLPERLCRCIFIFYWRTVYPKEVVCYKEGVDLYLPALDTAERYVENKATKEEMNSVRRKILDYNYDKLRTCNFLIHNSSMDLIDENYFIPLINMFNNDSICTRLHIKNVGKFIENVVSSGWNFSNDWKSLDTISLSRAAYEENEFSAVPILADALQELGCKEENLLNSMRNPEYVWGRGCRIIDELLDKRQ